MVDIIMNGLVRTNTAPCIENKQNVRAYLDVAVRRAQDPRPRHAPLRTFAFQGERKLRVAVF